MTKTAETVATAPKWWAGQYSSIVGLPICAQPDPKKNSIVVCGVRGTKEEAEERAALIVRAVNRDARFTDMVAALEHARARFRCLEDQFEESGDTASWAMCSVDADRMEKILSSIKAST